MGDLKDIAAHEGLTGWIVDAHDAGGKQREGRAKKAALPSSWVEGIIVLARDSHDDDRRVSLDNAGI